MRSSPRIAIASFVVLLFLLRWETSSIAQPPTQPFPPVGQEEWRIGQQPVAPPFVPEQNLPEIGSRFMIPSRPPKPAVDVGDFVEGLDDVDGTVEIVVSQGRLLTLRKELAQTGKLTPLVAVGDPTVVNFELVGPRHLRLTGLRLGVTDLSILTADEEDFNLRVHVIADLEYLDTQLKSVFPEASLELSHMREHVVVKGQARDTRQVSQILATIQLYLNSIQTGSTSSGSSNLPPGLQGTGENGSPPEAERGPDDEPLDPEDTPGQIQPESGSRNVTAEFIVPQVINMIRVPGPQQVLLKVRVAELNRTALRQIGVSWLIQDESSVVGNQLSGGLPTAAGAGGGGMGSILSLLDPLGSSSTVFGVFNNGDVNFFVDALRQNQVFKVLAEPNLVALHGQRANFLSGGQFPVLVPQPSGSGGAAVFTVQFKNFGVQLDFVPFILDDKTIRLQVAPEVSNLDFTSGVTISGTTVPGLNTRSTSTVVEIKEGQTLAISGILQQTMDGTTTRVPFLGDIPYFGVLFSRNSSQVKETELVILVTPYLVEGVDPDQVPALPGEEVQEPLDGELYLKSRIERRLHAPFRATSSWDDPLGLEQRYDVEYQQVFGEYGYSR